MGISTHDRKKLWGKSGNRCAICKMEILIPKTDLDDESLVGEECHIIAQSSTGPRGIAGMENMDTYENLIILCNTHHKMVDDQRFFYTKERLDKIKAEHEEYVSIALSKRETECTIIDDISSYISYDDHDKNMYGIHNCGWPTLSIEYYNRLRDLYLTLQKMQRTGIPSTIDITINQFILCCSHFLNIISYFCDKRNDEYQMRKFYKIDDYDPKKYDDLLEKYNFIVDVIEDLSFEMTRLLNRIVDNSNMYNKNTKYNYFSITRGPSMDDPLHTTSYVPKYISDDEEYLNFYRFLTDRSTRQVRISSSDQYKELFENIVK